jgi:hypothetical protein
MDSYCLFARHVSTNKSNNHRMKYLLIVFFGITANFLPAQTVSWTDSLSGATVYLHIDQDDFKHHKHRKSAQFTVTETSEVYHQSIISVFQKAIRKYPVSIIKENVERVYIYDQFDKEDAMMGTYIGRHGFFFKPKYIDGVMDTTTLEYVIHHEISHRLHIFNMKLFDFGAWKMHNDLSYGEIKSFDRRFNPDLYTKGFLHKYAVMNKLEDFTSFAEHIFMNNSTFWEAINANEKLYRKFELTCEFYESLDPSMNKDYFLKMNQIVLSNNY